MLRWSCSDQLMLAEVGGLMVLWAGVSAAYPSRAEKLCDPVSRLAAATLEISWLQCEERLCSATTLKPACSCGDVCACCASPGVAPYSHSASSTPSGIETLTMWQLPPKISLKGQMTPTRLNKHKLFFLIIHLWMWLVWAIAPFCSESRFNWFSLQLILDANDAVVQVTVRLLVESALGCFSLV